MSGHPDWLDSRQAGEYHQLAQSTWADYARRGDAPPPDDRDLDEPQANRRRPRWRPETVMAWTRPNRRRGRPPKPRPGGTP